MIRFVFIFSISMYLQGGFGQNSVENLVMALLGPTPIQSDLQTLCDITGGRITGSKGNEKAVEWGLEKFKEAGVDVTLMPFEMPAKWIPGETTFEVKGNDIHFNAHAVSKYMSPPGQYSGQLIYIEDVENALSEAQINSLKGNFLLVASDVCFDIGGLFAEYAFALKVETIAEKYNTVGIVFMSSRPQKLLYTFIGSKGIANTMPQFVMAREDAMRCIRLIESGKDLEIDAVINAETGDKFIAQNVIAEIKGSKKPEEIIIIGAHLDSWALGTGANDNGCNVTMMIDIARQMKKLKLVPERTIRFALWNGEEQGYFGSWAYTKLYESSLNQHKMALSVDIGSGAIAGFFTNGRSEIIDDIDEVLKPVFALGEFTQINAPIVGTDNFDFMLQGVPNLVANHLSANYGMNYHASSDTYDKVDLLSLKKNSAIVAALTLGLANADLSDQHWKRYNRTQTDQIFKDHNLEFTMRMFNVWDSWQNGSRGLK